MTLRSLARQVLAGLALACLSTGAPAQRPDIAIELHIIGFGVDDAVRAQLEQAAAAGGGKYHHSADEQQLLGALGEATGLVPAAAPGANPRAAVEVVLDMSSSMWGQIEGRTKVDLAREAIAGMLRDWDPAIDVGLTAFGHRRAGDCTDVESLLSPGPLDTTVFTAAIAGLTPTGKTPLTEAVRQAAETLRYRDQPATVILFSDGVETCNADPCALGAELAASGVRFTAHVIGFGVAASEQQLACLAQATGGLYLTAQNAGELTQALQTIGQVAGQPGRSDLITLEAIDPATGQPLQEGVSWTVLGLATEDEQPISAGVARPQLPLAPGDYIATANAGSAEGQQPFTVVQGQAATIRVMLSGSGAAAAIACREPNDSFGTAPDIAIDQPLGGSIDPQRDGDFCGVTVPGAGVLGVSASAVPPGVELVHRVYNADFTVIRDWSAALAPGGPAETSDLPAAGRYVLELRDSFDDAAAPGAYAVGLAFQPAIDATEPNDSFGSAYPMAMRGPQQVAIFPQREHNFLEVTVDHQGELTLAASQVPAGLDIIMRVFDDDYGVVHDWLGPAGPGQDTILTTDLPAPGRYVVEIADGGDDARDPQPFTLTGGFIAAPDAFEPNDRKSQAAPLAFGTPVAAAILPARDIDYFRLDAPRRGALNITASAVPADLGLSLRLFDANLAIVQDWVSPAGPGQDTILTADLPNPGAYYLQVGESSGAGRSVEPYTLTASFTEAADAGEPDDRPGQARPLALGTTVQTTLLPRGDVDHFRIEAGAAGPLTLKATGVPPNIRVALRVLNREFAPLQNWVMPSQPGQDTTLVLDLPDPGPYTIEVGEGSGNASAAAPFSLSASMP